MERGAFVLQDLYDCCPHYLLTDHSTPDQIPDPPVKRVYEKGEFTLQDLHHVAPHFLTIEHINTPYGILEEQSQVKYLGVLFDDTLTFTDHIKNISSKISKVVGALWKARELPIKIKLNIYHSLAASHLNFAILVWGSAFAGNITCGITSLHHVPAKFKSLNTIHNNAVRAIVCAKKRDHLSQIYKDLNLLKLEDMYYLNLAVFLFLSFTEKKPDAFENYLPANSIPPVHNTRSHHSTNFIYEIPRLQKTLTSIRFAAMALWNKLPEDLKHSHTLPIFKSPPIRGHPRGHTKNLIGLNV